MNELNNFLTLEEHEKITKLELPNIEEYKAIAFCHLGKFEEALKFCTKNSFESAYANYKLKNFKKALKIVKKNSGEKWDVLKSQILYGMGYFNSAFNILNKLSKDDEIVVNLQAMKSLSILTDKVNKFPGHKLYIKKREDNFIKEDLNNYKFKDEEIYYEFLYNKTFEFADRKSEFLEVIKKFFCQFPKAVNLKSQIANVEGYFEEINYEELSKTQKEIYNFNNKKIDKLNNGLHYLNNYNSNLRDNEYKWIEHVKKNNFKTNWNEIPNSSKSLNILRILTGLINKNMKFENIKKNLENIKNEKVIKKVEEYLAFCNK